MTPEQQSVIRDHQTNFKAESSVQDQVDALLKDRTFIALDELAQWLSLAPLKPDMRDELTRPVTFVFENNDLLTITTLNKDVGGGKEEIGIKILGVETGEIKEFKASFIVEVILVILSIEIVLMHRKLI